MMMIKNNRKSKIIPMAEMQLGTWGVLPSDHVHYPNSPVYCDIHGHYICFNSNKAATGPITLWGWLKRPERIEMARKENYQVFVLKNSDIEVTLEIN